MTIRSQAVNAAGVPALAQDFASLRGRVPVSPAPNAPPVAGRWWSAVRERLPVWVQLRCGIEPRTLAALAVVLVAAVAFAAYHFWAARPQTVRPPVREGPGAAAAPVPGPAPAPSAAPTAMAGASARGVVVDVSGKVRRPGLQQLPPGSRVADALEAAGGARPGADTTGLNRARLLTDGEQIVVGATGAAVPGPGPAPGGNGPGGGVSAPGGPVSLNSATLEQLDALPGVGPVLAQHIVDYRTRHGGFRSVTDLRHVNGIGARRFTDLKPLVQP
ncbi:ComEA family DNA-binding protein [Streptomyces sp. NPDC026206]|uniref:ComEA family DNA-binding protein n=1 Tax=Streptomyces sp. NPDC026206 TaxID=3157089 RepID=UPI00340D62C0